MATDRRRNNSQRFMSLGYVGVSLGLAVLLLPTIFRPPQDQQNSSAAFSPDAPPDDTPPEVIIQSLGQARSSTAGSESVAQEVVVIEEFEVPPKRQAVRAGCFGDPPRQTESLYSHLCVPAWTGTDNGGSTWQGVSGDEIRLLVATSVDTPVEAGRLNRDFEATDTETERELKVFQTYFNERYEFYGRYLQIYVVKVSDTNDDVTRANMREAIAQYEPFAFVTTTGETYFVQVEEGVRAGLVSWTVFNNPLTYYAQSHPYLYSFSMDRTQQQAIAAELVCKQWAGKPPGDLNAKADPLFDYSAPRKFGLIAYVDPVSGVESSKEIFDRELGKCGATVDAYAEYNLGENAENIAGSVTKMRSAGVTTVILAIDPLTPGALANEAEKSGYMPEFFCAIGCQDNGTGRLLPDESSAHFVALSPTEIPRDDVDKDWYRAYKEIDPEGEPSDDYRFHRFQQLAGGIQHAGTNLNPDTFWQGLVTQPCRAPEPKWSIGGCYSGPDAAATVHVAGDFTYTDYVSIMWMDNAADDPNSTSAGAWCYMNFGMRYGLGEMPTEPLPFRDPERCWVTPPRGEQG